MDGRPAGMSGPGGTKMVVMPGIDAFFDPEPRLQLMKEMGIDRTLLWPTLASVLEERVADDPDVAVAIIHALNEWMHEHWTFVLLRRHLRHARSSRWRTATTPPSRSSSSSTSVERKIFLIRVAPVPTWKGRKSFALPEFDPFWERVQELDLVVGMHSGDPGYTRYTNEWEGTHTEFSAFRNNGSPAFISPGLGEEPARRRARFDHRSRPRDAVPEAQVHAGRVRGHVDPALLHRSSSGPGRASAVLFDENPVEVFNRNLWLHIFHEPDPKGLIDLGIPVDHLMFGSDFPHPEGMADPLAYAELVKDLPIEQQELIMGGSLEKAMKVGKYAA